MFMLSVLWSDQNEIIIYRSFQDFKEFHVRNKNIYIYQLICSYYYYYIYYYWD